MSPRNLGGLLKLFTIKAFRMATSSHIFLNDNFLPLGYMKLSDETKVVQLWHGMGSFKKFGGSSETNPEVLKELKAATKIQTTYWQVQKISGTLCRGFYSTERKGDLYRMSTGGLFFQRA